VIGGKCWQLVQLVQAHIEVFPLLSIAGVRDLEDVDLENVSRDSEVKELKERQKQ